MGPEENEFAALIRTGIRDPVAIGLVKTLFEEAELPFIEMDQNVPARQESGNWFGWWTIRVPSDREEEAREILRHVERER